MKKSSLMSFESISSGSHTINNDPKNQNITYDHSPKSTLIIHKNHNSCYRKISKIRIDMISIKRALDKKYDPAKNPTPVLNKKIINKTPNTVLKYQRESKYSTFSKCIAIDVKTTFHSNIKYLWNQQILNNLKIKIPEKNKEVLEKMSHNANESRKLNINTSIPKPSSIKLMKRFECLPKGMSPTANPIAHRPRTKKEILEKKSFGWPLSKTGNITNILKCDYIQNQPINKDEHSIRFNSSVLKKSHIVGQVDKKFILININEIIVAIDQHAAHERIILNEKIKLYRPGFWRTRTIKPLIMDITAQIYYNLKHFPKWFIKLGLKYELTERKLEVKILGIPSCFHPQYIENSSLEELIAILFEQSDSILRNRSKNPSLTNINLPILTSRVACMACRAAYKFGDYLPISKCKELVAKLSECKLGFQCAHGRPNLIPLVEIID